VPSISKREKIEEAIDQDFKRSCGMRNKVFDNAFDSDFSKLSKQVLKDTILESSLINIFAG